MVIQTIFQCTCSSQLHNYTPRLERGCGHGGLLVALQGWVARACGMDRE